MSAQDLEIYRDHLQRTRRRITLYDIVDIAPRARNPGPYWSSADEVQLNLEFGRSAVQAAIANVHRGTSALLL